MDSARLKLFREEEAKLQKEKEKKPSLFPETTWVDNNETLEALGIYIPGKDNLPQGFLKLLPSDFIVEEIGQNSEEYSIGIEDDNFESLAGETVYATLVKCGLSTIEAVDELSKLLNIGPEKIGYAGIKDKDAITAQAISFRGVSLDEVKKVRSPHLFLKDVRSGKGVITRGGLKSNKFSILIRLGRDKQDSDKMKKAVEAVEKVRQNGFYNFFYLQRFGSPRLNNYKWGAAIMRGDYEKAVYGLISDPGLREIPYFLNLRQEIIALAPNWSKVLEKLQEFPLIFPSELRVVEHLVRNPQDFLGALLQVENQVVLWVSALASFVYNRRLSTYIMAGIKPPKTLPFLLSLDKNDWLPYADDLEQVGLFPPDFRNVKAFRNITLAHREIETIDHAEIKKVEVLEEGIAVEFVLGKGEYATTFLSHFVNLMTGKVPSEISSEIINIKKVLGDGSAEEVLEYFQEVNQPKH